MKDDSLIKLIDAITAILLGGCAVLFIIGCCTSKPIYLLIITILFVVLLLLNGLESVLYDEG